MRYWMVQIGERNGKPLWRGTGFNQKPGGMTWIGDERIGWTAKIFQWQWGDLIGAIWKGGRRIR